MRYLTLRQLLDRPEHAAEVMAARQALLNCRPVRAFLDAQWPDGYWMHPDVGYSPKYKATVWQIIFLAAMGVPRFEAVTRAAEYVLAHSRLPDGRFSARKDEKGAFLCLNGNLLRALIGFGYADDPRVIETRRAMADQIARDGFCCRYNSTPDQRPDLMRQGLPCAWGAVKALGALATLPPAVRLPEEQVAQQRAVDFLLVYDLVAGNYPTATEPSPHWHQLAFPLDFSSDVLEALEVLLQAGVSSLHPRLRDARALVLSKADAQGRWALERTLENTWTSFGTVGEPNKWVTLRALRTLRHML